MAFNLFGPATKCDIRVGYISTDRGFVDGLSIYEANKLSQLNPGTQFVFRNRAKIQYLNINEVNKLKTEDMLPPNNPANGCGGVVGLNLEGDRSKSTDDVVGALEANAQGGSTQLLTSQQLDVDSTRVQFYGGGGVGVQANPIIGNDGSLLAIDLVHGGFGYQYPPIVDVQDDRGVGSGAVIRSYVGAGASILIEEFDREEDFEEYDTESCAPIEIGFGQRYGPDGKDLGSWDPGVYVGKAKDPIAAEIDQYQKQLASLKPGTRVDLKSGRILDWWTTRHGPPLKVTSPDKETREKHDVQHYAWGGKRISVPGIPTPPPAVTENFRETSFVIYMSGGSNYGLKFNFIAEDGSHKFSVDADDYKGDKEHKQEEIKIKVLKNTTYNVTSVRASGKTEQGLLNPSSFGGRGVEQDTGSSSSIFTDVVGSRDDDDDLQIKALMGTFKAGKGIATGRGHDSFSLTYRLDDSSAYRAQPTPQKVATRPVVEYKIEDTFMNRFAISPVPPSNVKGSDNAGKTFTFEWEENFPWEGDYVFKGQRDNVAKLYIDQDFISDLDDWKNGPKSLKKYMSAGVHKITVDLINVPIREKVKRNIPIPPAGTSQSNVVTFKVTSAAQYANGFEIEELGINISKEYKGPQINESVTKTLEYGRVYTVKLTSAQSKEGVRLRSKGNNVLQMEEAGDEDWKDIVCSATSGKFYDFVDGAKSATCKFKVDAPPPKNDSSTSVQGEKIATIFNTVDWIGKANRKLWKINSAPGRNDGNFINRYGVLPFDPTPAGQIERKIKKEVLFKPKKPTVKIVKEGEKTYLKVIGSGRVKVNFELNVNDIVSYAGLAVKEVRIKTDEGDITLERRMQRRDLQRGSGIFTAGNEYPIKVLGGSKNSGYKTVDSTTLAMDDDVIGGFDTNATLKVTGVNVLEEKRTVTTTESSYPQGPNASTDDYAGFHDIIWNNIKFPADGNYAISTMVDDSVVLTFSRVGSPDIVVTKKGFINRKGTGKTTEVKYFKAGAYTLKATLEQIPGRALAAGNPMALAVDIQATFSVLEEEVVSAKSWNDNPMGLALTIDAPMPPKPVQPEPEQEGRCPNNPIWSTRMPPTFPVEKKWWPVRHGAWGKFMNKYAISPLPPLGVKGTDGSGTEWINKWTVDLPYAGFYGVKGTVDNFGKIFIDGKDIHKLEHFKSSSPGKTMVELEKGKHVISIELKNEESFVWTRVDQKIFSTGDWASKQTQTSETIEGPKVVDVTFKTSSSADYANAISVDGLFSESKIYKGPQINSTITKKVEVGKVYDVTLNSGKKEDLVVTPGTLIQYTGLKEETDRRFRSGTRLEFDDDSEGGRSFDVNGAFTIDKVNGGTAVFDSSGKSINVKGNEVKITLTYSWNDIPGYKSKALERIKIGSTTWTQRDVRIGSETHTITLSSTSTGGNVVSGNNDGKIQLRTKGSNVLQMEDIWGTDDFTDIICSSSQGEWFDLRGNKCKFRVASTNKTVIKYGEGLTSGSEKNGVTYSGPPLATYRTGTLGPFLTPSYTTDEDYRENRMGKTWSMKWTGVDFPETGNYDIKAEADDVAFIKIDGIEVAKAEVFKGVTKSSPRIIKGKRNVEIVLTNIPGNPTSTFFTNPTVVAAKITRKVNVKEKDPLSGTAFSKPWTKNPLGISAVLIPPPCPKVIKGVGIVTDVTVTDPGNGFSPPPPQPPPGGPPAYPVQLELDEIVQIGDPINYGPGDLVCIETPGGGEICYEPEFGNFGEIEKVPLILPGAPGDGVPDKPRGYTRYPNIRIKTLPPKVPTGSGGRFVPKLVPVRTPPLADPDTLIQVTDLVGLKQTGYYDGKPYYGAVFFKDGVKYAGFFETAGRLVQIYDTMQESIDATVTTPPSAMQRAGTDINSNNPRLNLPNTPDNLT